MYSVRFQNHFSDSNYSVPEKKNETVFNLSGRKVSTEDNSRLFFPIFHLIILFLLFFTAGKLFCQESDLMKNKHCW